MRLSRKYRSWQPNDIVETAVAFVAERWSGLIDHVVPQPQMKNVPLHERSPLLSAAIQAGTDAVQGQRILLIDDLWETGSTLRRVAEVLAQMGATEVRALAMTRTK